MTYLYDYGQCKACNCTLYTLAMALALKRCGDAGVCGCGCGGVGVHMCVCAENCFGLSPTGFLVCKHPLSLAIDCLFIVSIG